MVWGRGVRKSHLEEGVEDNWPGEEKRRGGTFQAGGQ